MTRRITAFRIPKHPNQPCRKNNFAKTDFFSCSEIFSGLKPAERIHSRWLLIVDRQEPISATAATRAEAVSAGDWPMQRGAACLLCFGDSIQVNRECGR